MKKKGIIVYSSLFPSKVRPNAGVFIRERMFRVGEKIPIVVVSPVAWFPLQKLIKFWKPGFRQLPFRYEKQNGIDVYYPRFLSFPGILKNLDGFFMAIGSFIVISKLKHEFRVIDSHFAYPDGYAATLLGHWLNIPRTITLRGTEVPLSKFPGRRKRIILALEKATKIFSVADSLKRHVITLGAEKNKIKVIGNGVDTNKFHPLNKDSARKKLQLPTRAKIIISVGGLVDRKGFHRVIEVLPELVKFYPDLIYLIVGGGNPEGNNKKQLEQQIATLNVEKHVRFLGALPSEQLKIPLSAADVFVLATSNEGWANVFLEAMACGLPVVTTNVGGNQEVVCNDNLGKIVSFGKPEELMLAIKQSLNQAWSKDKILEYAAENSWDKRVKILTEEFAILLNDQTK